MDYPAEEVELLKAESLEIGAREHQAAYLVLLDPLRELHRRVRGPADGGSNGGGGGQERPLRVAGCRGAVSHVADGTGGGSREGGGAGEGEGLGGGRARGEAAAFAGGVGLVSRGVEVAEEEEVAGGGGGGRRRRGGGEEVLGRE